MLGFQVRRLVGAILAVQVTLAVAGCTSLGGNEVSRVPSNTDEWPPAKASTPLEVRKALEAMDVFGECLDARKAEDGGYAFYYFSCVMVPFKDTAGGGRSVSADRGVTVFMFDPGVWPVKAWLCGDLGSNITAVTDNQTFFVLATSSEGKVGGNWPPEVWPADVAAALGGKPVTIADFGCPG